MKYMTVGALIISAFAFTTGAMAATVGKSIIRDTGLWGYVDGGQKTSVYRLEDKDNKTVCYFAYYGANSVPDMECVK